MERFLKALVVSLTVVLTALLMTCAAYAANGSIYKDTFDLTLGYNQGYDAGNLNGQHDWITYTSGGTVQVIEATTLNYSKIHTIFKSVEVVDNSTSSYVYAKKSFSNIGRGSLTVWMRAEQTNGSSSTSLREDTSLRIQAGFRLNGKISYYNGTAYTDTSVSYVANTWYKFVFEFDCSTDKYTLYVYDSSNDLKVYITDIDFYSPATAISTVQVSTGTDNMGIYQFDDISINETDGYGDFDTVSLYDQLFTDYEMGGIEYRDDSNGGLAWGESYVLESLLIMYQTTTETKYIDDFIERVDRILETMNLERPSATDWEGRNAYSWNEQQWPWGTATLYDSNGLPCLEIFPQNPGNITNPNFKYIFKVEDGTNAGTFKLTINYLYNDAEVYDNLVTDDQSADYVETRVNDISDWVEIYDLSGFDSSAGRPENIDEVQINRLGLATIDTIGLIGFPLAMYARMVNETPALYSNAAYLDAKVRYLGIAEELLKEFDDNWRTRDDNGTIIGWYGHPKGEPIWSDGSDHAVNKNLNLGRMIIELYNATNDTDYRDKAIQMARWFKTSLEYKATRDCYLWHYAWSDLANPGSTDALLYNGWDAIDGISLHTPSYTGYKSTESLHYSGYDVSFVALAYNNNDWLTVFDSTDIERFINTFRNSIRNNTAGYEGRLYGGVYGTLSSSSSFYNPDGYQWLMLSQFESTFYPGTELIYSTMNIIYDKQNHLTGSPKLLTSAYLNQLKP